MPHAPAVILIIDDIPANLGVMVDVLETEGYRALVARNGAEGFRCAETEQPDLILLDVMMPGENGFSLCRCRQTTKYISCQWNAGALPKPLNQCML